MEVNPESNRDLVKLRFRTNMARLGNIAQFLAMSRSEGAPEAWRGAAAKARGDILRAMIVLLHATFEDAIRSYQPKPGSRLTLQSMTDVARALERLNLKPAEFCDLTPAIIQMARRRNRIVHHADLPGHLTGSLEDWCLADEWQLIHWHLVVSTFLRRMWRAFGGTNVVEDRAWQNVEAAVKQSVGLAQKLVQLPTIPRDHLQAYGSELANHLEQMRETLRLDVSMFTG